MITYYLQHYHVVIIDLVYLIFFFFSSRRRHTRWNCDWSSDVCSSDLRGDGAEVAVAEVPFEEQHFLEAALLRHLAAAQRHEVHGGELARDDGNGPGRLRSEERRVGKGCRSWWWRDVYNNI